MLSEKTLKTKRASKKDIFPLLGSFASFVFCCSLSCCVLVVLKTIPITVSVIFSSYLNVSPFIIKNVRTNY